MTQTSKTLPVLALLLAATVGGDSAAHAVGTDFLFSFGTSGSGDGQFSSPTEIAIGPTGDVFVFDAGNGRIQKFSADGTYLGQWSSNRAGYPATNSIAIGAGGRVLLQAWGSILHYDADGNYLYRLDVSPPSYPCCTHLDTDPAGNLYWSRQIRGNFVAVSKYSSGGVQDVSWDFGGGYNSPVLGAAIDASGTCFLPTYDYDIGAGMYLPVIRRRISNTTWTSWPGHGRTLDVDDAGHLFAANEIDHRIDVWTTGGVPVTSFGTFGTEPGQFSSPWDVEATPAGRIYVVDKGNHRVQVFGAGAVPARAISWGRVKAGYR